MTRKRLIGNRKLHGWAHGLAVLLVWNCWTVEGQAAQAATSPAKPEAQSDASAKAQADPIPMPAVPRTEAPTGRRDPFRLPSPPGPGAPREGISGLLPPGKRGLVISQMRLEGVVRLDTTGEMIAVVDTHLNRAFFLRENDQLYNGVVARITPDAVYFRENILDPQGRVTTREVVRRLGQGAGEGR